MKYLLLPSVLLLACVPAFGDVTVSHPIEGATVVSPFALDAVATPCASHATVAMGYSIDDSAQTTIVRGAAMNALATAPLGAHLLHVKSWGEGGTPCVTDVHVNVVSSTAPAIPTSAIAVNNVQTQPDWVGVADTGAGGASGAMSLVSTPSLSGSGRQFQTTSTGLAGERYYASLGTDRTATDFVYDTWVYLASPSNNVGNLEFIVDQVIPNGQTVIFGLGCDNATGYWEYTQNAGTPQAYSDVWTPSTATCDPQTWGADTWHHVQLSYARDDSGNVTYQSVWLDGAKQDLNVTVSSAFALGWDASVLLTNFQVDGKGLPTPTTVYLDDLNVYRWTRTVTAAVSLAPLGATAVSEIQGLPNWRSMHDAGTIGSSSGAMSVVSSPSVSGSAREFMMDYANWSGERYWVSFDSDPLATNFLYDGWVYLASPTSGIGNLELDMNQVMANGQTVIFGIQCDGGTGTWDYTRNGGDPVAYLDQWIHSTAPCNPRNWTPDTWHHVQFSYARDGSGNVTYKSVWLDGAQQDLNATVPSSFALGWGSVLLTNVQIDGLGPLGSAVAYVDNLTIYRW